MDSNIRETLRTNLIKLLDTHKISQKEFAKKIGVTPAAVNNWMKGSNSPNIEIVAQICSLFSISIADILGQKEEHPNISTSLQLSSLEEEIVEAYRAAPDVLQKAVLDILHIEAPASPLEQKRHA